MYLVIFSIRLFSFIVNQVFSLIEASAISCLKKSKHDKWVALSIWHIYLYGFQFKNIQFQITHLFFPQVWHIWGCCTCYTLIFWPSLHCHSYRYETENSFNNDAFCIHKDFFNKSIVQVYLNKVILQNLSGILLK